ncbi:proton channel OtopLc-like isoform X2 [Paramacrobiotus metropolitanus]|nr:proton channel OtopLc-like isoform X2 [Paramacrobiotus metropolitanus]
METSLGLDKNGHRRSPTSTPSTSPLNASINISAPVPIRQFTSTSAMQQQQQSSSVVKTTTGLITSTSAAGHDSAHPMRSPGRLIHEIKTASQESQADSGHDSGHGSAQPHTVSSEFQPFLKSTELFETHLATESSKLLNTPNRGLDAEADERVPTPIIATGMGSTTKMDLERAREESSNTTWRFFSLLYALLLIVLGTAFPTSEIIAAQVKPLFYQAYYVYLFGVSILFLIFAYIFLLQTGRRNRKPLLSFQKGTKGYHMETVESASADTEAKGAGLQRLSLSPSATNVKSGSFYLRMGAVVFGVGSMIYSCLEFGQYFEIPANSECNDILVAVVPACRFFFSFIQLYFVFLNSKIRVDRFTKLVWFGLMHMVATNICIWLSVLIGETKHELELTLTDPDRITPAGFEEHPYPIGFRWWNISNQSSTPNVYKKPLHVYAKTAAMASSNVLLTVYPKSCRAQTIIGNILQKASPFLYPCIVEYSLICAAMLYIMWRSISTRSKTYNAEETSLSAMSLSATGGKRQRYTVDCHGATKGLFIGLLMIVVTIISMILFFVWIWRSEYYSLAVFQAYVVEISLYTLTFVAVCMAFVQMRDLKFESREGSALNDLLLIISQFGVYIFCTFILISGHHTVIEDPQRGDLFALLSALLEAIQATVQTLFLLDATRRRPYKPEHLRDKPGRELVTFLLVCNFGLWAVESLEAWKQQLYPAQQRFYGSWSWTIIMNISMPLTIFYRFHSSVCLSEIWKRAWKVKSRPSTPVVIS